MTAREALEQMHNYSAWESFRQPEHIMVMLDQWADTIEAELKAKDAEIERLKPCGCITHTIVYCERHE